MKAVAVLSGDSPVKGAVFFEQHSASGPTTIRVQLKGVPHGHHGFHVHEFGDNTNGCFQLMP